jgi:hypothetical protein
MPAEVTRMLIVALVLTACTVAAIVALFTSAVSRSSTDAAVPAPAVPNPSWPEVPWLTAEAAAQVVGTDDGLGPLFAGVELGGPPPPPDIRDRIDRFARANRVDIDLEVVDGAVAAVRFGVTFSGCCGYEGADELTMQLGRPKAGSCCSCDWTWVDTWSWSPSHGVHLAVRVRVNRVDVRWEREATFAQVYERANALIGRDAASVGREAGDRWFVVESDREYLLEVPYPLGVRSIPAAEGVRDRDDLGLHVMTEHGRVTQVSFVLSWRTEPRELVRALRLDPHLGQPYVEWPHEMWFRRAGHTVTLRQPDSGSGTTIAITKRGRRVVEPSRREAMECAID